MQLASKEPLVPLVFRAPQDQRAFRGLPAPRVSKVPRALQEYRALLARLVRSVRPEPVVPPELPAMMGSKDLLAQLV